MQANCVLQHIRCPLLDQFSDSGHTAGETGCLKKQFGPPTFSVLADYGPLAKPLADY